MYEKFEFQTDFDEEIERERQERLAAQHAEPTFAKSELEAAKAEAFEAGKAAGLEEAKTSLEAQILQQVQNLEGKVAQTGESQQQVLESLVAEYLVIFKGILAKVMPKYIAEHGEDEAVAVIQEVLETCLDASELKISVPTTSLEALKARLEALPAYQAFPVDIVVEGDESLGASDCAVSWGVTGGASRNASEVLTKVEQTLDQLLAGAGVEVAVASQSADETAPEASESSESQDSESADILPPDQEASPEETVEHDEIRAQAQELEAEELPEEPKAEPKAEELSQTPEETPQKSTTDSQDDNLTDEPIEKT